MLKNPGQVGNLNSSPNVSTPRTVKNMEMGEPIAKKFEGSKFSCGYLMLGTPMPESPTMYVTNVPLSEWSNGYLQRFISVLNVFPPFKSDSSILLSDVIA